MVPIHDPDHSQKAVPTSGKIASSNQGSTFGPSVLPQVTTCTAENVRAQDYSALLILSTREQEQSMSTRVHDVIAEGGGIK